jgi:serine phosphatase RsbU (regulator of sigma subunit)
MVKQKQQLEDLVEKRTEDLVEANKLVTKKNVEITSSIHYAERIQQSLLPKQALFNRRFKDHFIIFMPRDIVSGDFFWAYEKEDMVYISAVDCTGHGVPGAFMSMLGMSFLKEIVERHQEARPGVMLNDLRNEVITALQQDGEGNEAKDGMDMSLVSINTKTLVLEYAGANNSIIISRKGAEPMVVEPAEKLRKRSEILVEIQPDKMPIAIYEKMNSFSTVRVQLIPGDSIYLFSDGFPDQFGGPKNKKLMQKRLRQTLEKHYLDSMEDQKIALMKLFNDWKGQEPQVDDVTLIGWRV